MNQASSPFPEYGPTASQTPADWVTLTRRLWEGRRIILTALLIGTLAGVAIALLQKPRYTATTLLMPQSSQATASQLSGLASLAGINLDLAQSSDLSPVVYPRIANSLRFKLELMYSRFTFDAYPKPITLYEYFTGEAPAADSIAGKQLVALTPGQVEVKRQLDRNIYLSLDKKEGFLTLKVTLPEALAAAQVAQKVQELLQRDIIRLKTEKAQADLDFIQERYNTVKAEAEGYQSAMTAGSDRFKDLVSSVPKLSNTRLQTRYAISNSVFQELAKQLEQAKIQVKKDTPVFTVIEPLSVPYEKEGSGKKVLVVVFLLLGGIAGLVIVVVKNAMASLVQRWNHADRS
jgi:uncharacterized protein involved in exopolysaccharide biosynthesis